MQSIQRLKGCGVRTFDSKDTAFLFCGFIFAKTAVHMVRAGVKVEIMPVSGSAAASMTALVLSLAALIFLTRMCASPPQRLVSELLTPRTGLFCWSIMLIFLSEMAVHIVRAGAKLEINGMPVSFSVAALIAALVLSLTAYVVFTRRCDRFQVRKSQSAPSSKFAYVTARMGAKIHLRCKISQVLLMYSLLASAAAASLDEDIQEGKRHIELQPGTHAFSGANVSGSLTIVGASAGDTTVECSGAFCSDGRAGFA